MEPTANEPSPLMQTIDQLWRALYFPTSGFDAMAALVDQVIAFMDGSEDGQSGESHEVALAVMMLAETAVVSGDAAAVRKCLARLPQTGPMGQMLAASFISGGKVQQETVRLTLDKLDGHELLGVVNRFLSVPRKVEPRVLAWAAETVHDIQSDDPEETLLFLDALAKTGEYPSYAVQRELLHGRFGFWLQELLAVELNEEQARYMANTASRLDWKPLASKLPRLLKYTAAADLPNLFRLIGRPGGSAKANAVKASQLFLKHRRPEVRLAAARALVSLKSPQAVPSLLKLYADHVSLRPKVLELVFLLGQSGFVGFVKGLPAKDRASAMASLCAIAARVFPEYVKEAVADSNTPAAQALAEFVKGKRRAALTPVFTPRKPQKYKEEVPQDEGSLFGRMKKVFAREAQEELSESQRMFDALRPGVRAEGKTFSYAQAKGRHLERITFSKCTLSHVDLSQVEARSIKFIGCTLKGVDFGESRLSSVVFDGCALKGVRFSGAALVDCRFINTNMSQVYMNAATVAGGIVQRSKWTECCLWGARFEKCRVAAIHFGLCDFSKAALVGGSWRGVEFHSCAFHKLFASDAVVDNALSQGCWHSKCSVMRLHSDAPALLREQERSLERLLRRAAVNEAPVPVSGALAAGDGVKFMIRLLESIVADVEFCVRRRQALVANKRRTDWCSAKLGREGSGVLAMLPGLVEAGSVRTENGEVRPAAASVIKGYSPGYAATRLLEEHFEGQLPAQAQKAPPSIHVDAFYSIGSVGSIAQTKGSDIDMWVCFDAAGVSEKDIADFKTKLVDIEKWAETVHGLELHFFVMELDKVRENNFGFSDKESAGSSQALLLKEEFYRTAVLLAGKKLAWWMLDSGISEKGYAKGLSRLAASKTLPPDDTVDLGHMSSVPRDEFFGACLWQIVKALKSPFKSIMKFALLDAYASGSGPDVLLCNKLKRHLFAGSRTFWEVDPYAVLFHDLESHYRKAGNEDACELVRTAFEQKTSFSDQVRTTGRATEMRGFSWLEYFFPYALEEADSAAMVGYSGKRARSFEHLHDLGKQVAKFMFSTYESISGQVTADGAGSRITSEDLTKLGRKIFGHFQPKVGKVMHVPFVESPSGIFSALEIVCDTQPGVPPVWIARGEVVGAAAKKIEPEELRREKSPVRLCAWLIANHLFVPGMQVRGANLKAPVSTPDLRALLEAIHDALPPKVILDPDIEEAMRDEEIAHALIVVNFMTEREVKDFKDVVVLCANNWGELFCLPGSHKLADLEGDPLAFIHANTGVRSAADLMLSVHYPKRSQARKILL